MRSIENLLNRLIEYENKSLEFQAITSFTLEEFKQLYLSGVIRLVPGNNSISQAEIHKLISKFGLNSAINKLIKERFR